MKPLRYSQQNLDEDDIAAVVRVLRSDWIAGDGPEVERFEQALCAYTGARYAVAVSSGTAALHLAYLAAGTIDHLVTSPLSFVATANAALMAGYTVGFTDVDQTTGNMAHATLEAEVLVPVHYAGRACPMPGFGGTDLLPVVIEDACHALGAMDFDGCSRVGSCAHSLATVFSFHPCKPITAGEGGAVTTNDQGFADEVRLLRSHGRDASGRMVKLGLNYRLTDLQAALGTSQLERCDWMRERRVYLALVYHTELKRFSDEGLLTRPPLGDARDQTRNAWHLYPIRIKNDRTGSVRDSVKAALNAKGIAAQIHYPCIHLQPYWKERFGYHEGQFPEAEAWAAETMSLPLHAGMVEADVTRVVEALREVLT